MLVMKKGEKGEKGLNLFKCNMCNKIYKSNNGLWVHKKNTILTLIQLLKIQILKIQILKIQILKTQIIQLERGLADSKMRLLQARDYARGCAAELGEAQINFATHQQLADRQVIQARKKNQAIYASRTWKIGRLVMLPSRIVRRLLKAG